MRNLSNFVLLLSATISLCMGCSAGRTLAHLQQKVQRTPFEPEIRPIASATSQLALTDLEHRVRSWHIGYQVVPDLFDTEGFYGLSEFTPWGPFISLDSALSVDGRVEVLSHEMAHLFEPFEDHVNREIWAESIAFLVCKHYGLNTANVSASYIKSFVAFFGGTFDRFNSFQAQAIEVADYITGKKPLPLQWIQIWSLK